MSESVKLRKRINQTNLGKSFFKGEKLIKSDDVLMDEEPSNIFNKTKTTTFEELSPKKIKKDNDELSKPVKKLLDIIMIK